MCTLALTDPAGKDNDEWKKFFHLMDLATTWQGLAHDTPVAGDSP
jgi:hypothetical protein